MKKFLLLLLVSLMLFTCLFGNVAFATTYLPFPTASTSGTVYAICASLANIWNEKIPGVQVSAEASNGGVQNLTLIADGEAKLGVAVTSILTDQKNGVGAFQGRAYDGMRVLTGLYMNYNQVVVSKASGINTIYDIEGKRFAPGAPGGTPTVETEVHFKTAGINFPDGFKASFVGFTEAVDLMRNKQMDGAWIMAGIPTSAVSELCATADAKLVPIDEEIITKLSSEFPWYARAVIPAGTYEGQDEDVVTTGVTITICIDESVPEDIVYNLTKTMYENIDNLKKVHNALKDLTVEKAVQNLAGLPIHDGALKYYKEAGVI
ncbi:MAG: TAXI family TRAP transporter solute-binding subunit [Christensenellales bacterium]|jgi:TRAP transporter TAXI family solute receptor